MGFDQSFDQLQVGQNPGCLQLLNTTRDDYSERFHKSKVFVGAVVVLGKRSLHSFFTPVLPQLQLQVDWYRLISDKMNLSLPRRS